MMLENVFSNVLEMSLSASFLIVAVLIARIALRKSSKLFRKALWGLVAFKLVVPFSFESALSLVPHQSEYVPDGAVVSEGVAHTVQNTGFDFKVILCYIWLAVLVLFSAYGIVSFLRLKHKISDAVLLDGNVFQSEKVESPFVFGMVKPKIYIPFKIKGKKLDYVLKHEKTHIKYFDHITKLLGFAILCVHWFNPLVWVSYALFCKDVELACDESVIKDMSKKKRKGYAVALYDIGVNKAKISACPVAFGEVSIKEWVKSVVRYKRIGKTAFLLSVVLCVAVGVFFMTSPEKETEVLKPENVTEKAEVPETTEVATEPVTEVQTEAPVVTEPITEPITETTEVSTEVYSENDSSVAEYWLDEDAIAEIEKDREDMLDQARLRQEWEMEEFSRQQELAGMQNKYNNNNNNDTNIIVWDNSGSVGKYGNYPPQSPYRQAFENNYWVGWDY